jgi:hypothetical protein
VANQLPLSLVDGLVRDAMAAAPGTEPGGHYPYVRQVRLGWRKDAGGHWTYDGVGERLWEVLCAECGDTDGPQEEQPSRARELRGPYPGKRKAGHVASKHFKAYSGR